MALAPDNWERFTMQALSYRGYRFPPVIIQHSVRLYLRFTLSSHMHRAPGFEPPGIFVEARQLAQIHRRLLNVHDAAT